MDTVSVLNSFSCPLQILCACSVSYFYLFSFKQGKCFSIKNLTFEEQILHLTHLSYVQEEKHLQKQQANHQK